MENVETALELFSNEFNCAQAVLVAFADKLGLDEKTAIRISSSFGGGVARNGELCGAVSGALMVIGLKYWNEDENAADAKLAVYEEANAFMNEFKSRFGSCNCKDLLGCDVSTEVGRTFAKEFNLSSKICTNLVKNSVEILNQIIAD